MGRALVALVSDLHTNSKLGLCSPQCVQDEGEPVPLTKAQQWLWQCWQDYLARLKGWWRPGTQVYGVVVGDGPDNFKKSTQMVTGNPAAVVRMFVDTVREFREICADGCWIVRGTEAHGGDAGHLEELAAVWLQATHYPADSPLASCWLLRLDLGGVTLDLTHHGPLGRLPWTTFNGLNRVTWEIVAEYLKAGEPLPQVAVQAHNHRFAETGREQPIKLIGLPCWQLQNAYGFRVGPRRRADIGGVILVIEDGQLAVVDPVLFTPKMEARWTSNTIASN